MRIKRFTAKDLPTAVEMIKKEFGQQAIILSQRESASEGVEVTAGVKEEDKEQIIKSDAAPLKRAVQAYKQLAARTAKDSTAERLDAIAKEVAELKDLILNLAHQRSLAEKWRNQPHLVRTYRKLLDEGIELEIAKNLIHKAAENSQVWGGAIEANLSATFTPFLNIFDGKLPKYLSIIGPGGSGKTLSLLKLAAYYRKLGVKVSAISLDSFKLGAVAQLSQHAGIMGLGLRVCQNMNEFLEAIENFESDDLILIDTAGRSFNDASEVTRETLKYTRKVDAGSFLVIPASMKEQDIIRALNISGEFNRIGVIISKVDETQSYGNIINVLVKKTLELAFFSRSPKAPDELLPATIETSLSVLFKDFI